ncbi:peptidase S10, serine carboxypeptidase [Gigaspora margarita]|uniref:Peptidase S10, serine carboxypeptidase n=1 Tax=Gigaspora margarita TaxID=4874 RepID=A0A8H4EU52_GIGMA|nr:peptidase S10, serine carboxypeptidase [Gigaspora margarita]
MEKKTIIHSVFLDYRIKFKEPSLCDGTVQQYSGYLVVNGTKKFFFWFFESRNKPQEVPLVLWWTRPTNTGYSYSDEVVTTSVAANDVYAFLQLFLYQFPNYAHFGFSHCCIFDIRRKCDGKNYCYSEADDIVIFSNLENIKTEVLILRWYLRRVTKNFLISDADFLCNWFGVEVWVKELKWRGTNSFNNANVTRWITKDTAKHAGGVRTFEVLTFLRIFKTGHMAQYDQPGPSLDFFKIWLSKEDL